MTPLGIDILMHYVTRADDYRSGDFSAPAVRELIDRFHAHGLLARDTSDMRNIYMATDGATLYLEALCKVPLPIMKWAMP